MTNYVKTFSCSCTIENLPKFCLNSDSRRGGRNFSVANVHSFTNCSLRRLDIFVLKSQATSNIAFGSKFMELSNFGI